MKVIKDVCLVAIDCYNYGLTVQSIRNCIKKCKFDRVLFLTDIDLEIDGIEVVKISPIKSKEAYSTFVVKELYKYFDNTHCLIVQHDGTILDENQWDEKFKEYDVIGAKWLYPEGEHNCGNGGFSLKSHKLLKTIANDNFIEITHPEDEIIGRLYRRYLENKYSIKFATNEVCDKFSFELNEPVRSTFGCHANFWQPFKPHIVLKRTGACGDLIMLMPVVDYFNNKGYQVVLDTQKQFMDIFFQHPYKIKHISEVNKNIVPEKVVNFDMCYELKPQQPVLKSYYEFAGIKDGKYVNSKLHIEAGKDEMLFSKYILIHIDDTGMEHRNQHGIDWSFVVKYYERLGYLVFQIGKRRHEIVAPYLNTYTLQMLMFTIRGADLLIGVDSGNAQIAVALGTPAVIMAGSVNLKLRYSDFSKIQVVHTDCPTSKDRWCYHEANESTVGKKCEHNETMPPCTVYNHFSILEAANKLLPQ